MTHRLGKQTALVTGATSNIGRAIARRLAAEGAHVAVSGRNAQRGRAVVDEIRAAGGVADFVPADLDGSRAASHALAEAANNALGGRIDVLVNNAGVFPATPTLSTTEETFDHVVGVNVKAAYFLTQAVVPQMAAAGRGVIINLGSWVARLGIPSGPLYASTKGAMETLTRGWSAEFAPMNIRVNGISPGVIREATPAVGVDYAGQLMSSSPAGRPGTPDAIAAAAAYLASDDAAFVHGTVIDVDGGRVGVAVAAGDVEEQLAADR